MRNSAYIKFTESDYFRWHTYVPSKTKKALAQIYICELKRWTNDCGLELAPQKCSLIDFTRCKNFL